MKKKFLLQICLLFIGGLLVNTAYLYNQQHKYQKKLKIYETRLTVLNDKLSTVQEQNTNLLDENNGLRDINISLHTQVRFLEDQQVKYEQKIGQLKATIEQLEMDAVSLHLNYKQKIFEAEDSVYYPMKMKFDSLHVLVNELEAEKQFLKSQYQELLTASKEQYTTSIPIGFPGRKLNKHKEPTTWGSILYFRDSVTFFLGLLVLAFVLSGVIVKWKYGKRRLSRF